ncbi:Forkhead protein sep1 [Colletotrichum liriopes]|uniref:Forkhead protein sep1 n=1 Tax=Colletotrichum liriopes TaxID=708192 RepID=A0AA37LWM6_9PEZI|nr:forkhead protein sep1 [Colletotrichum liriopes]GJC88138.1 Forkhead protein sep1 [Colletotrichum liriopes]
MDRPLNAATDQLVARSETSLVFNASPGKEPKAEFLYRKPYLSTFKTYNPAAKKPKVSDPASSFKKHNVHFSSMQKGPGKRTLVEAAAIKELRTIKKVKAGESSRPPHDFFPSIADDGSKPRHTYATLIGMAILRSPQRRLPLPGIYRWISATYSFYKAEESGWQNIIRHNLSIHKVFIKVERPSDDPGKGNYWAIQEGMEQQFMNKATAEDMPYVAIVPNEPSSDVAILDQTPGHYWSSLPPTSPSCRQLSANAQRCEENIASENRVCVLSIDPSVLWQPKSSALSSGADRSCKIEDDGKAESAILRLREASNGIFSMDRLPSTSSQRPSSLLHQHAQTLLPPLAPTTNLTPSAEISTDASPKTSLLRHREYIRRTFGLQLGNMPDPESRAPLSPAFDSNDNPTNNWPINENSSSEPIEL